MVASETGFEPALTFVDHALLDIVVEHLISLTGPRPRVVVAFSGGVDSTVLAHRLVRGRRKLGGLRLVHVDHGLQVHSAEWGRQCAQQARAWRVPFKALRAPVRSKKGDSPEAAAREARYATLIQDLAPGDVGSNTGSR